MKLVAILVLLSVQTAAAVPECTKEPKDKWKEQKAIEKTLQDQGYKIRKFNTTEGNCYQILGWDKDFRKVEILMNPVTGEKVKEEKHR